jgi:hypothetical protein
MRVVCPHDGTACQAGAPCGAVSPPAARRPAHLPLLQALLQQEGLHEGLPQAVHHAHKPGRRQEGGRRGSERQLSGHALPMRQRCPSRAAAGARPSAAAVCPPAAAAPPAPRPPLRALCGRDGHAAQQLQPRALLGARRDLGLAPLQLAAAGGDRDHSERREQRRPQHAACVWVGCGVDAGRAASGCRARARPANPNPAC